MKKPERIGVMTSGGDSPGMNAAVRAVARTCAHHGVPCYGIERGYQGLLEGAIQSLGPRDVSGILNRGGTILGSARCKPFYEAPARVEGAKRLEEHAIDGLVVIGGDGSYRGAHALYEEHGIRCIGVPGTIDNDIGGTDYTIGYDTALNTAMDAIDRIRDTAASHDRLFYIEVMGRNSGYIAMMSGIAGGAEEILVPEEVTKIPDLVNRLRLGNDRGKKSNIVVVSEGDDAGKAIDIAREVAAQSEFNDYRVTVIGHMQRGGSPTAFDRILASRLGLHAVEGLLAGETGKMAGVLGKKATLRPLSDAWEGETQFDLDYLRLEQILAT
jgi:6-phosphofructokinase 1